MKSKSLGSSCRGNRCWEGAAAGCDSKNKSPNLHPKPWPCEEGFVGTPASQLPLLPARVALLQDSFVLVGASRSLLIEQFLLTLMETITNSQINRLVS